MNINSNSVGEIKLVPSTSTKIDWPYEYAYRAIFGDYDECAECPRNMECMSGNLPESFKVASSRQEHKSGEKLFCIDEGEVKVVIPEPEQWITMDELRINQDAEPFTYIPPSEERYYIAPSSDNLIWGQGGNTGGLSLTTSQTYKVKDK